MESNRTARRAILATLLVTTGLVQAATAPSVVTLAPTSVTTTSASLNGSVDASGVRTTVTFDFGSSAAYGTSLNASPSKVNGSGMKAVSANASGLTCGTTYHYRANASNRIGSAASVDLAFNTAACAPPPVPVAPTAATNSASGISASAATLNGSASAGSAAATLSFEYGTTTAYGASLSGVPASLAANAGDMPTTASLAGLACATTYHFRARAASSVGTALGANQSFVTASCALPPPPTACSSPTVHCVDVVAGPNQEFSTIQAAVNVAVAGDTVLVFDGNYVGFVVSRSGTASAPITVKANGTGAVVDRPSNAGEGIRVNNSSYVVIEGFTVTGISGYGLAARGATPTTPMHGVVFRDNTVRQCASANIYASEVSDSLIEGNTTSGSTGSHGIYLANAGSDNTTIRGNLVFGNAINGLHLNGDASVGGDGIVSGVLIEDNVIHDNVENGINMDGVQSTTIRNNVVYANGRHALRGYRIDAAQGPLDLTIVNNTLSAAASGGGAPIKLTEDLGGHTIFNNILANEGGGGSIVVGNASFKSNQNTFVNASFSLNGGSSMLTLAQWRAQAGAYDTASQVSTQDALFLAPSARDYRLRTGSAAANAGTAAFNGRSAPADDILGVARPLGTAVDQGAFESF